MKISVADLKKVVKWVEANSNDTHVNVYLIDNFVIQTKDKYEAQVELILYEDSSMLPKIKKVDFL